MERHGPGLEPGGMAFDGGEKGQDASGTGLLQGGTGQGRCWRSKDRLRKGQLPPRTTRTIGDRPLFAEEKTGMVVVDLLAREEEN
jgi:hypothetical protein